MKKCTCFIALLMVILMSGIAMAGQWETYTAETTGLLSNEIRAICIDNFGVKWFGTADGLTRFNGKVWTTFTSVDDIADNSVNAIDFEVTSHGPEIWVATDKGVSVISVVPDAISFATPYTTDNTGLISNKVQAAAVDTGHVKWFGTDQGLSSFTGSEWASYTVNELLTHNDVLSIAVSANGWLYFGTNGSGVTRFDGVSSASPYDTDWTGIASDTITAGYITDDNVQWFGTDNGISRHIGDETKENWTTWTVDDGIAGNYIYDITEDQGGKIWIGTSGGASSFDGVAWESLTSVDGLSGTAVYSIAVEDNGTLWFGTDAGVSHYIPDGTAVDKTENRPEAIAVRGCYPNPFNPTTTIEFYLPHEGAVELSVFNINGQLVRRLVSNTKSAGVHTAVWDGCDEDGLRVSSGIYLSRLTMGAMVTTGKMVLAK